MIYDSDPCIESNKILLEGVAHPERAFTLLIVELQTAEDQRFKMKYRTRANKWRAHYSKIRVLVFRLSHLKLIKDKF